MIYKNFYIVSILRVIILALSVFVFVYSVTISFWTISIILVALTGFQIVSLIRYVNKTNRELTNFLESIRFSDFSRSFQMEGMGTTFDELNKAFNNVIKLMPNSFAAFRAPLSISTKNGLVNVFMTRAISLLDVTSAFAAGVIFLLSICHYPFSPK